MGNIQEYYIKKGKFKNIFNGIYLKMQLFLPKENRIYTLTSKSDTLCWEDCQAIKDEPISYEIQKNKEKILNVMCDLLIVKTKQQIIYFYYNSNYILIDTTLFENNNYNNWYYTISKTGALSYKTIIETGQFIATSVAVEIKEITIPDEFFNLPSSSLSKICK